MMRIRPHSRRSRTSCSLLAIATALVAGPTAASAQSFNGSGSFSTGTGSITTGAGTTNISLTSPKAVINWTPTDNATNTTANIVFQNSGTTATFSSNADFAVLNNINSASINRAIQMNGTVNARVSGSQRGSVYFYAPGGFVIGGSSVFSVGSLVLTTLPITDSAFSALSGGFGSLVFGPAANANSTISMSGTVNANFQPLGVEGAAVHSYVAMVAPRVVHNGSITVNGTAALVAAEAATINFSPDGLFDIQVTTGTTDSEGLNVHGDIGGPTPNSVSDVQGIYLVAVPKNQLMTMVIGNGADLGFTLAGGAYNDNGTIVLSAGHDIKDGDIDVKATGHGTGSGNFWFTGAHATNNLFGEATGYANLYSVTGQPTTIFDNDVTVHATEHVWMNAGSAATSLTVGGNLSLSANQTGSTGQSATAGDVQLYALNGGTLTVAGTTSLTANAIGGNASAGSAGSGAGGSVGVGAADGSTLTLSNLTMSATGTGGNGLIAGVNAGNGTGGLISVYGQGGTVSLNSPLVMDAQGYGGNASGAGLAGIGSGGTARATTSNGGTLTFAGDVTLDADGHGGSHATGKGGNAFGGTTLISATSGAINFNGLARLNSNGEAGVGAYGEGGTTSIIASSGGDIVIASLNASADGWGGNYTGSGAGAGQGGDALMQASGAGSTITVNATPTSGGLQNMEMLSADGFGGDTAIGGTTGGTGTGGTSIVKALSGGTIALPMSGNASFVRARGYGGLALANGTTGGLGDGGYGELLVDGGTVTANLFQISVIGQGGTAPTGSLYNSDGGDGIGGERHVNVLNGGVITLSMNGGFAAGIGGDGTGTGSGGDGSGGLATLTVDNATANFTGNTFISVNTTGGAALGTGSGGNASGGTATAAIRNGGVVNMTGSSQLTIGAGTVGGNAGGSGTGGNAIAGNTTVTINGGTFNGGTLLLNSAGQAGGGGSIGGLGDGGTAILTLNGATIDAESVTVDASGIGGNANSGNSDVGGNGIGGIARINNNNGTSNISLTGDLLVTAEGQGGSLLGGGGQAGNGTGGTATLYVFNGSLGISADTTVDASGTGGDGVEGGAGGAGLGDFAEVGTFGGSLTLNGGLDVLSMGTGGNGFDSAGGHGTGVYAGLFTVGGTVTVNGTANVDASGHGGNGSTGGDGFGGGEVFVNFDGAHIYAQNGTMTINGSAIANSSGYGGNGQDGDFETNGGDGGNGAGGYATIHAANSNSGPSSISIIGGIEESASVFAEGHGGAGGHGGGGNTGGDGGDGGDAAGGWATITAAAGNGHVDIGFAVLSAQAWGGHGGDGGNGDGGAGGAGGDGGRAFGGGINVGTESGSGQAGGSNLGLGEYGSIFANASAWGGDGGEGSFGATDGNGGAGGSADGGIATLLVRGSTVDAGFVDLVANATGGDGGFGGGDTGAGGIGGDAESDEASVLATSRYLIPSQHGTLLADVIMAEVKSTGGSGANGAANGASLMEGGSAFHIDSADATIGSVSFAISAEGLIPDLAQDYIQVTNGDVTVANGFSFVTPGNLSLYVDNGSFTVGALTLSAGNFINNPELPAPANLGTTYAGSVYVTTGQNFVADTNWDVTNTFIVDAPGLIALDNIHDDNGIDFSAGGTIDITSLDAGTYIDLLAAGAITTGGIQAGTNVNIQSTGSSVTIPNVNAGGNVALRGGTTVTALNINSGGNIFARSFGGDLSLANLDSNGSIQLYSSEDVLISGDIDAGTSLTSLATGQFNGNDIDAGTFIDIGTVGGINLDHLTAGDDIDLASNGPITILTALAGETINFETMSTLTTGNLTAGDSVLGQAIGAINVGNVSAGFVNTSTAVGAQYRAGFASEDNITTGAVAAAGNIGFGTPDNLLTGNLNSGGGIMALVGGNITLPTVNATGYVFLADHSMSALGGDFETFNRAAVLAAEPVLTGGSISISGPLTAGSFVTAAAGTTLNYLTINAGGYVDLRAGGSISGGALMADGDIDLDADGNILFTTANAGGEFDFNTGGNINGGNVVAGNEINGDAGGSVTLGNLTAGVAQDENFSVGIKAIGNINVGNVSGPGAVGFATQGNLLTGTINAGDLFLALVGGNTTTGAITTTGVGGGEVYIADDSMLLTGGGNWENGEGDFDPSIVLALNPVRTGGFITINGPVNTGRFRAAAGTNLTTGTISSGDAIALDANGAITTGDLDAGNFVLANAGSITTGDIDADSVEMISTTSNITTGDIDAFGSVELDAFGDILTGDIVAASIDLYAGDDITTGNLTTQQLVLLALQEDGPITTMLFEGASITLESGGDILAGDLDSIDGVYANAGGSLTTGTIDAVDFVYLNSVGNMATGSIDAGTDLRADSGAAMSLAALGTIDANDIELDSIGNMTFGNINAGTEIDFSSGGNVNGGNIVSGLELFGDAEGSVTLGNLTSGFDPGEAVDEDIFAIGIVAGGNINVANVSGARAVGFATLGNLTTGNISADGLVMTLVDGNIVTGSITTSGEDGGQVYMADASMCEVGGGCADDDDEDFDPFAVLRENPVRTGGSITINGPVSTGVFRAAAGTSFTANNITANGSYQDGDFFASGINVRAGGLATINGMWTSPYVELISNDISIGASGGINGGANGQVLLRTTNGDGFLVGDGLTGSGYALSNAEFSRISSGEITIVAGGFAGADADSLIGDLTITGPLDGSNIESGTGSVNFVTLDESGEGVDGTLRVVGDINATGFTSTNSVNFITEHFELDAATGSVSVTATGGALSGEIGLYADTIHVASGQILDKLASNPTYTNYQTELNKPATVQRPDGVLRADTLWIESNDLQDVLIQNTGGQGGPAAGFLVRQAFINDDEEVAGPPGSINLVVNGQVVTEGGTLTGIEARDALVTPEDDITPFTSNSTINGCPLTGQCIIRPPEPPPSSNIVDNTIDIIFSDPIGDSDFGNEDTIDDNEEGDEESRSNPINPPQPLFDTRPLIPSGDVNDPISGTGNPALLGSEPDGDEEEEEEKGGGQ